jgi:hypothetical protein
MTTSGFVAGTLVHTDKGLVSIEQLKVGDRVLSKHESSEGHDFKYQQVKQTMQFSNSDIYEVCYASTVILNDCEECIFSHAFVTEEQHIWVIDTGWLVAKELKAGDIVLLQNGCANMIFGVVRLHKTCIDGIAYSYGWGADDKAVSKLIDFRNGFACIYFGNTTQSITDYEYVFLGEGVAQQGSYTLIDRNEYNLGYGKEQQSNFKFFGYSYDDLFNPEENYGDVFSWIVYNIEVEDYHTYFIGKAGILTHNASNITTDKLRPHED